MTPPKATRNWAQHGALIFLSLLPSLLRGHPQFAMKFVGVAMKSQRIHGRPGLLGRKPAHAG